MLKVMGLMKVHKMDYTGLKPFVFGRSGGGRPLSHARPTDEIIACPFDFFSIEMKDGYITVSEDGSGINIDVMVCRELSYDNYEITIHAEFADKHIVFVITKERVLSFLDGVFKGEMGVENMYESNKAILDNFLLRLRDGLLGTFNAPGKSKFKNARGEKKTFIPSNVIYVGNRRENNNEDRRGLRAPRGIEWHHSWSVRSHWRKLSEGSMGLDRKGERVVEGATWIASYTKGIGELVDKVRVVK